MATKDAQESALESAQVTIAHRLEQELNGTPFVCHSLRPLTGGSANFIFHGLLAQALEDGTREVVVKHGEGYVASSPAFKLPTSRCQFEEECLKALAQLPADSSPACIIRTPRFFHFNPETHTLVQEYLPDALNLKSYALSHFSSSLPELRPRCLEIGCSLGRWLRNFHDWAEDPAQSDFRAAIKQNKPMQILKNVVNYDNLLSRITMFPTILGDAKEVFELVAQMSKAELADESRLQVIHGDFWTGNALLPDEPLKRSQPTIFIIDWEMCQFGVAALDLGQMIAELYQLYLFKGIRAGLWLIEGFSAAYGIQNDAFAYRTATHIGTHLLTFGTAVAGWGTEEQIVGVVRTGRELILRAWRRDRAWFMTSDLACLFRKPGSVSFHPTIRSQIDGPAN